MQNGEIIIVDVSGSMDVQGVQAAAYAASAALDQIVDGVAGAAFDDVQRQDVAVHDGRDFGVRLVEQHLLDHGGVADHGWQARLDVHLHLHAQLAGLHAHQGHDGIQQLGGGDAFAQLAG